jgi:hypothetical protein
MVVVKGMKPSTKNKVHIEVFCSSFSELTNIPEVPTGSTIEAGSLAYTASGAVAIYNGSTWTEVQ